MEQELRKHGRVKPKEKHYIEVRARSQTLRGWVTDAAPYAFGIAFRLQRPLTVGERVLVFIPPAKEDLVAVMFGHVRHVGQERLGVQITGDCYKLAGPL